VDLPQVQVVGLEPAEGLVEHPHRQPGVPAVGAALGHDEGLVPPALEGPAEALLRAPGVGAVVHEPVHVGAAEQIDATVEGIQNQPHRLPFVRLAAEPEPVQAPSLTWVYVSRRREP